MKKYFITGLVTLLPLALTFVIVMFLVNFLTQPFVDLVKGIFDQYGLMQKGFLFFSAAQIQRIVSQFFILVFLFFLTVGLGVVARWFFVHYLIRVGDYLFHQIPIVRSIYKTSKDVIQTIFESKTKSFKQVVLVPFPKKGTQAIGLVTRERIPRVGNGERKDLIAVFVPTTPNPTSGFLMMFDPKDLVFLDMPVEEAFKYIISCGVIQTPFNEISPDIAHEHMKETEK